MGQATVDDWKQIVTYPEKNFFERAKVGAAGGSAWGSFPPCVLRRVRFLLSKGEDFPGRRLWNRWGSFAIFLDFWVISPRGLLLCRPSRFTPWLMSPFCFSIGTGPPQVSLLSFPVCFPRLCFPLPCVRFVPLRFPHPFPESNHL